MEFRILNIGMKETMPYFEKKMVKLTNGTSLFMIFFWLFHSYVFYKYFENANYTFLLFVVIAIVYVQVILLNYLERHFLAKILLVLLIPITIYASSIINKINIEQDLLVFFFAPQSLVLALSPIAFLMIEHKRKIFNYAVLIYYIILTIVYAEVLEYLIINPLDLKSVALNSVYIVSLIIVFIVIDNLKEIIELKNNQASGLKNEIDELLNKLELLENELNIKSDENAGIKNKLNEISTKINEYIRQKKDFEERFLEIHEIAKFTQQALMKPKVTRDFLSYFILNYPLGDVSGDFFFIQKTEENEYILVLGDCTGHGISSAFITLLAINSLRDIINDRHIRKPAAIIKALNDELQTSFRQTSEKNIIGVEIAIVKLMKFSDKFEIIYSGAKMPVYFYKNNTFEIVRLKPDPYSIGSMSSLYKKLDFKETKMQLETNDIIYMISDGWVDQIYQNKRYGTKNLINFLNKNARLPLENQKKIVEIEINKILEFDEQLDDILIVALKLK